MLDTYSHIRLTEEEIIEAMIWAKRKKEAILKDQEMKRIAAENRKLFVETQWDYKTTYSFMQYKSNGLFDGKFIIDENNEIIFKILCLYFSKDQRFVKMAEEIGVKNPTLEKGILLAGVIGTGKTWMMKLFSKNQRQCFFIRDCPKIAETFANQSKEDRDKGKDPLQLFYHPPALPVNDTDNFLHTHLGLCLDDMGKEEIKNFYGNRKNVIGDLIETRYSLGNTGIMLHGNTNLSMPQFKDFYGDRVGSRVREIMNVIELKGSDRRK